MSHLQPRYTEEIYKGRLKKLKDDVVSECPREENALECKWAFYRYACNSLAEY